MSPFFRVFTMQLVDNRDRFLRPLVLSLLKLGVSPTVLNFIGAFSGVAASVAIGRRNDRAAMTLVLVSTVADVMDGAVARASGSESPWGAVLDASCDRLVDTSIYGAYLVRSSKERSNSLVLLSWLNVVLDTTRSFVRVCAEARLPDAHNRLQIGVMTRPRKLALLLTGLVWPQTLPVSLGASALLSAIGLLQRLQSARSLSRHRGVLSR